jgi:hypothetical protein
MVSAATDDKEEKCRSVPAHVSAPVPRTNRALPPRTPTIHRSLSLEVLAARRAMPTHAAVVPRYVCGRLSISQIPYPSFLVHAHCSSISYFLIFLKGTVLVSLVSSHRERGTARAKPNIMANACCVPCEGRDREQAPPRALNHRPPPASAVRAHPRAPSRSRQ